MFVNDMILIRTINYQREVDKGKLNAIASLKKADVSSVSPLSEKIICSDKGLTLETSAFQNSLRRLIYFYQLHVDN